MVSRSVCGVPSVHLGKLWVRNLLNTLWDEETLSKIQYYSNVTFGWS